MWSLPTEETPLDSMPAPNLIPQGGGAFVGSIPRAPDPPPHINEFYLQDHKERMPAPNLLPQGGGAFVGSIPRAPDPAPPIKLILFTRERRVDACPKLNITGRKSFFRIQAPGSGSCSS
jgi:hypothetical protein